LHRLVLAEPPAVSLLQHLPGNQAEEGKAMFADIQTRMVAPMRHQFAAGDRTWGIATFMAYVFNDHQAWAKMSPAAQAETLRDAHEWDVMKTSGVLFPPIEPETIRGIPVPVLLISGPKSYPFIRLIDEELARLLPHKEHFIVPDVGHQMWLQAPKLCREKADSFLRSADLD
jgi:pimeloyl-ACP methyl ester carboxylesterase